MSLKDKLTGTISVGDFISTLLFSRTQVHVFHLQTNSYATHKALETYYEDIVDLVDTLVETYQGTNSIIKLYSNNEKFAYGSSEIKYLEGVLTYVQTNRLIVGEDSDMQNIVDEIVSLIKQTLYKLKNLH